MNSLYSSDTPDNSKAELNAKGFNLNVEQNNPLTNAEVKASSQGGIVDAIVQKAATSSDQEKRVLDELQKMDTNLSLDLPMAPGFEKNSSFAKFVFFATLIVSILVVGYLAFANSNQFFAALGIAPANEDTLEKQSVANLRSQKIANNLIASAIILEKISLNASKYAVIVNSDTAVLSVAKKNQLKKSLTTSLVEFKNELSKALTEIQSSPEIESELVIFMSDQLSKVKTQASQSTSDSLTKELKRKQSLLEDAIKLMRAKSVVSKIKTQNIEDKELLEVLKVVVESVEKNPLAKVAKIQIARVSWTSVFNELEYVLKKIDPTFDVFNPTENGKIVMSSYSFITETGTVSIAGQITTPSDETFSVIADTVDALEGSTMFKDIAYRSYSKSYQEGIGYRSSVNFTIKLESNA